MKRASRGTPTTTGNYTGNPCLAIIDDALCIHCPGSRRLFLYIAYEAFFGTCFG